MDCQLPHLSAPCLQLNENQMARSATKSPNFRSSVQSFSFDDDDDHFLTFTPKRRTSAHKTPASAPAAKGSAAVKANGTAHKKTDGGKSGKRRGGARDEPTAAPARSAKESEKEKEKDAQEKELSPIDKEVAALESEQREKRKALTVWRRPLATLVNFSHVLATNLRWGALYLLQSNLLRWVVLPVVAVLAVLSQTEAARPHIEELREDFMFALWWIGLGVAASIGLGTGEPLLLLRLAAVL